MAQRGTVLTLRKVPRPHMPDLKINSFLKWRKLTLNSKNTQKVCLIAWWKWARKGRKMDATCQSSLLERFWKSLIKDRIASNHPRETRNPINLKPRKDLQLRRKWVYSRAIFWRRIRVLSTLLHFKTSKSTRMRCRTFSCACPERERLRWTCTLEKSNLQKANIRVK